MPPRSAPAESLYRLADGLFPLRLEPGKPLLMGREGSPLHIELRTLEKQGMNALLVYDPSGAAPSSGALAHALEPLTALVGEPIEPPPDAPPNARAFSLRLNERAEPARAPAPPASPSDAPPPARDALTEWLDDARLQAMLWAGLADVRKAGKDDRDIVMALFDAANTPGERILVATYLERGIARDEAVRSVRSNAHLALSQGARLVFQVVDTRAVLDGVLESGGILETHGPLLDSALATLPAAADVPAGYARAVVFEEAALRPQLVAIRSPGERAADARAEQQDAILQDVLDAVGEELRALHAARVARGNAPHNLAILVEELAHGELKALVAMRSEVAAAIGSWGGERARPIVKELGKSAPAGMTHAVFAMRREMKVTLIHRTTVVQGEGTN